MRTSNILAALALAAPAMTGCIDLEGQLIELNGLWSADSIEYESNADPQLTVDLVERDGASMTLSVDEGPEGPRVNMVFNDGMGGSEVDSGLVDLEESTFTFESAFFTVEVVDDMMTITNVSAAFDFGTGSEAATLTVRLTRL